MRLRLFLTALLSWAALGAKAAETPPVSLSFGSQADFDAWTVIAADPDKTWSFSASDKAAKSYGSYSSTTNDDWLISPAVQLQAGVTYEVTYTVKASYAYSYFSTKFTAGMGTTADAQSTEFLSSTSFNPGTSFKAYTYEFVPEATGEYNFAMWDGTSSSRYLYLQSIAVAEQLPLPGAATALSVTPAEGGALSATLHWTWPTATDKGKELASIKGAKIYRTDSSWASATDGNLIATVPFDDATPGGEASWVDTTLPKGGYFYYFVKPYNEHGDSPSTIAASGKTAWLGPDTPKALAPQATLGADGLSAEITWTLTGANGGPIVASDYSYAIERTGKLSGKVTLEEAWQGTLPYVDALPQYDSYTYSVKYIYKGGTPSAAYTSAAVKGGPAIQPPFSEDFSTSGVGDLWSFPYSGKSWSVSSGRLSIWATKTTNVNAWAVTPPLALKAGMAYKLRFNAYKQTTATEDRTLKAAVAAANTLDAMNAAAPVIEELFTTATDAYYEAIVTVPADGTYYIGLNATFTATNSNDCYIDNITLEESAVAPVPVADLAVTPDAEGALQAVVSWTNPSADITGAPIAELSKVELYHGDELIETFTNPAPGEQMQKAETYAEAGVQEYSVISYMGDNASQKATVTSPWIGTDLPAAPEGLELTRNADGSATLSWSAVTAGAQGGYVGSITYTVTNAATGLAVAEGITDTSLAIDAPESLGMYSFSVAATNARGTGDAATSNSVMLGSGIALPYTPTIDADALELWALPANASGKTWTYNSSKGGLYSGYSADIWAFTPPLTAAKGTISLTVAATAYSSRYPETLQIGLYTVAEIGAEALKLDTITATNTYAGDNTFTLEYNIPAAGTYFIGYHLITKDAWGCTIVRSDVEQTLAILPSGALAIADLTLTPDAEGANSSALAWTYPTLNESGDAIEAIDSTIIYRNNQVLAKLAGAQSGAPGSYADAVPEPGLYSYSLVTYTEGFASQPARTDTLWVGRDQLPAVAEPTLSTDAEGNLIISFQPATKGAHGGYIPTEGISYTVVDDLSGETVAQGTDTEIIISAPEAYDLRSYSIYTTCADETSEPAHTNSLLCGKAVALDYANSFASDRETALIELRPNSDGNNWKFVEQDGDHYRFFQSVDGAELVTPPFLAKEGTIKASALARCFGALFPETFKVALYAQGSDEPAAVGEIVSEGAGFVSYRGIDFNIAKEGVYRIGFTVEKKQIQAYIDGIKIEQTKTIYDEIALPAEDLSADAAPKGELKAIVSWTNPTLTVNSTEICHLAAVKVLRGTELVDSLPEPQPGAVMQIEDSTVPAPGVYTYSVVAVTDKHLSDTVSVSSAWIGLDTAAAPVASLTPDADGTALLCIEPAEAGINGGYVGEQLFRIVSSVDGQITAATDKTEIEVPQPESLDVYSFTVWATGANGEESTSCTTESVALGEAIILPHAFDFSREEIFSIWQTGAWEYSQEGSSLAAPDASELVTPPFLAKMGTVSVEFTAQTAGDYEISLLGSDLAPASASVVANAAANAPCKAIVDVPAHQGLAAYRISVKNAAAAAISAVALAQDTDTGLGSLTADANLAYDAASGTIVANGPVRIFTASGMLVRYSEAPQVTTADLPAGVYIATCGSASVKFVK